MKEVTDPDILAVLNSAEPQEVTDPELMRQLDGGELPEYGSDWGQYGKDVGRSIAQGLTFNTSDEAIAGVRSLFGTPYEQAIKEEREALKRIREHHPVAAYGGELAGGLVMPGGAIIGGALKAPTLAGRMVRWRRECHGCCCRRRRCRGRHRGAR
jgi:hypothetical protein